MGTETRFAYCQARIQARFADLPGEDEWSRLAGSRTLSGFIEEARTGPLRPWVKGFSALSEPHAIERGVRALAWDLVHETAHWVPGAWREAVRWVAWLPALPALRQMARGGPMPGWVARDYGLHPLLGESGEPDRRAIDAIGLGGVVRTGEPDRVAIRWLAEWRRRCDDARAGARRELDAMAERVKAHLDAFRLADPEQAWGLRRTLREELRLKFHQRPLQPVAVFLYLGMVLLDLERLRAAMLARALLVAGEDA